MHEFAIAQNLINIAQEQCNLHNAKKVLTIKVKVGKLTSVIPDALLFSFEAISKGTPLEGARLNIESVPLVLSCDACRSQYTPDEPVFLCPECQNSELKIVSGRELYIESMEVE
jgi:hydrogenase nickel incorporation protein HypA/HybF